MKSRNRPRYVTWLSLGVLIFSSYYLVRLALGLNLPDIPLSIPQWYLPLTGAVWGGIGFTAAYGLFCGYPWSPAVVRWGALAFALWYWADRLFLARSEYLGLTWPAALAIMLPAILGVFWLLSRPGARHFFGESS